MEERTINAFIPNTKEGYDFLSRLLMWAGRKEGRPIDPHRNILVGDGFLLTCSPYARVNRRVKRQIIRLTALQESIPVVVEEELPEPPYLTPLWVRYDYDRDWGLYEIWGALLVKRKGEGEFVKDVSHGPYYSPGFAPGGGRGYYAPRRMAFEKYNIPIVKIKVKGMDC